MCDNRVQLRYFALTHSDLISLFLFLHWLGLNEWLLVLQRCGYLLHLLYLACWWFWRLLLLLLLFKIFLQVWGRGLVVGLLTISILSKTIINYECGLIYIQMRWLSCYISTGLTLVQTIILLILIETSSTSCFLHNTISFRICRIRRSLCA